MYTSVNHNMMAANTARNLNSHYVNLATSTQRLSSGLRINSAADDATGLAIRELQRADIAALHQGARNAHDAISMIQVADGALGIIDEKLIRMKELAEQAATGTYDSTQRLMIDSEYVAMGAEIDRIVNATDFNGIKLLDGSLAGLHDGSGLNSTGAIKIHFGSGNDSAEDYYYIEIGDASLVGLGLAQPSSKRPVWWDMAEIDYTENKILLDLNSISSGAMSPYGVEGLIGIDYFDLPIGLKNITVTSCNGKPNPAHKPHVNLFTKDGTQLTGYAARPVEHQSICVWSSNVNKLIGVPAEYLDPNYINPPRLLQEFCDYSVSPPKLLPTFTYENADLEKGIRILKFGSLNPNWNNIAGESIVEVGIENGIFNADATYKGDDNSIINKANQSVTVDTSVITVKTDQDEKFGVEEIITISEITENLVFLIGGHDNNYCNNYNLKITADFDPDLFDNPTRIKTQQAAQEALVKLDLAIEKKDKIRAHLGALQNRLENTISNLNIQAENLQASESRISDVDVATEMTNFVRNQILTQSATAMLSQANNMPQMMMQLIGG